MLAGPSALSLVAAFVYMIIVAAAAFAALPAMMAGRVNWHRSIWLMVAALFLALALMRVFAFEEWLRGALRSMFYSEEAYENRGFVQKPLVMVLLLSALGLATGLLYALSRRVSGQRDVAAVMALGCTGAMLLLAALRLVSLHSVDALLYGPLKLNWFLDLGLTAVVFASALAYCLADRQRQR
jgi:hypothetical protein